MKRDSELLERHASWLRDNLPHLKLSSARDICRWSRVSTWLMRQAWTGPDKESEAEARAYPVLNRFVRRALQMDDEVSAVTLFCPWCLSKYTSGDTWYLGGKCRDRSKWFNRAGCNGILERPTPAKYLDMLISCTDQILALHRFNTLTEAQEDTLNYLEGRSDALARILEMEEPMPSLIGRHPQTLRLCKSLGIPEK